MTGNDTSRRRLCAHADSDGEGMHWLEPGERCAAGPEGTGRNHCDVGGARIAAHESKPSWRTRAEAIDADPRWSAFDLATYWGDRTRWPAITADPNDELHELATISALAEWLRRWMPIHVHKALLGGKDLQDVANAACVSPYDLRPIWEVWARGQLGLYAGPGVSGRRLGISPDEAAAVRQMFGNYYDELSARLNELGDEGDSR